MSVSPLDYHDRTKHHFHRFARSLGYLDWAAQPDPFRRYAGSSLIELPRDTPAATVDYRALFEGGVAPVPLNERSLGEFLRCSMGLSAWKQYGASRWALRVNPSSGNLHPTETYLIHRGRVFHYAAREHALEERGILDADRWAEYMLPDPAAFLVALTSIHWREAWKYGERAFRYCQHDAGHAIGALRLAAALLGWRLVLLPRWSDAQLSALLGLDRDQDYGDAEREEPDCVAVVTPDDPRQWVERDPATLAEAAARGSWCGTANRLSANRVEWPVIDEVARATRYPGRLECDDATVRSAATPPVRPIAPSHDRAVAPVNARSLLLSRRSALAFDGGSVLKHDRFFSMLRRLRPPAPPWDAIDWPPQVHLILFVHRVDGLAPGVYAYVRDNRVRAEWQAAMRTDFLWEPVHLAPEHLSTRAPENSELFLLVPIDCRYVAKRLSCDQDIAADGFFSLAMVARLESLGARGDWFYRRLFWECGLIGQVLYLEAEAAGARATGIGCYYDDPVHEMLGLTGHTWQSLYHFSMGTPIEDTRLTTESGYDWERGAIRGRP